MSVATHLGLDPASTAFIELEQHWAAWVDQFPRLARAGDFHALRGWLAAAEPAEADEVLHTLATLGSPSGADDLAAASVLAWALLPGACALAHRLRGLSPRIDEVVAAQLWLEIRSFPWHRLHKVAANILANTRAARIPGMRRTQPNEASRQGMDQYSLGRSVRQLLESTRSRARRRPVGRRRTAGSVGLRLCSKRDYRRGQKTAVVVG